VILSDVLGETGEREREGAERDKNILIIHA
jgi:hypothetical protein